MNIAFYDNYKDHQADYSDINIQNLIYEIKTEAISNKYCRRLYYCKILAYEPYGCKMWIARHRHHLKKYTSGTIQISIPILNDAIDSKQKNILREQIIEHAKPGIIIGNVGNYIFERMKSSRYSPKDPNADKRRKYNSPNYIFHHSEIYLIRKLQSNSQFQ